MWKGVFRAYMDNKNPDSLRFRAVWSRLYLYMYVFNRKARPPWTFGVHMYPEDTFFFPWHISYVYVGYYSRGYDEVLICLFLYQLSFADTVTMIS